MNFFTSLNKKSVIDRYKEKSIRNKNIKSHSNQTFPVTGLQNSPNTNYRSIFPNGQGASVPEHELSHYTIVRKPSLITATTKKKTLARRIGDSIINSIRNYTRKNRTDSVLATNKLAAIQPNSQVRKFMTNPTSQNIRTFLDKICPNTGQCISFGVETDKIRRYFNNFNFALSITNERVFIGSPSSNGFIIEIPFVKDNYKLYSILKSAKKANADNLYYEAFVGIFINKKNDIFPCFLETYGSYYWPEEHISKYTKLLEGNTRVDLRLMKRNPLTYDFFLKPENIQNSYCNSKFYTVMIQHIHKATSLHKYITDYKRVESFFSYHLVQYLYQIYCPLAMMSNEFTHYDLHTNNVMLYTVGETLPLNPAVAFKSKGNSALEKLFLKNEILDIKNNKQHVTMKYYYPSGEIIEFNTFNIAKILDYGRSFFYDKMPVYEKTPKKWVESTKYNSNHFYQLLKTDIFNNLETVLDNPECEYNKSYKYLADEEKIPGENYYITSYKRNKSHDLRLCDIIRKIPNTFSGETSVYLRYIFNQVVFEDTLRKQLIQKKYPNHNFDAEEWYGTPEIDGIHFIALNNPKSKSKIHNVEDMHLALKYLITNIPYFKQMSDDLFKSSTKIGEIHIWVDGSKSLRYVK
jgi:hypothetical protein